MANGEQSEARRELARRAAEASANSPKRTAPLRLVQRTELVNGDLSDVLECGHSMPVKNGLYGRPRPKRRRCLVCLEEGWDADRSSDQ